MSPDYRSLAQQYQGEALDTDGRPAGLVVRCAEDIIPKSIHWLWRRRLARDRYIELVGFPGIGKTAVVMDLIARLTTDGRWPDGSRGESCDVLIVAAEDEADDVLVPRLIAAGADLARVHFVDGIHRDGREHPEELDLSKVIDFVSVVQLAKKVNVGFIYIDALDDVLGAKHDGKGNTETRRALAPVRRLARETGAAVLGLRHPTKRVGLGPALNQGNGSIAYGAVARGSLLVPLPVSYGGDIPGVDSSRGRHHETTCWACAHARELTRLGSVIEKTRNHAVRPRATGPPLRILEGALAGSCTAACAVSGALGAPHHGPRSPRSR